MKKQQLSKIEFNFFISIIRLFRQFPFSVAEKILANLMRFGGTILRLRYDVASTNLKMVFPDFNKKQIKDIISTMYYDMGRTVAETYFADNDDILNNSEIVGFDNIYKALESGKGAILATLHMGNWELAGIAIARKTKMSVVLKRQRNRYFDKYTNELREKEDIVLINKKNALRPILSLLKQNYVVGILMDQNAGKNGIVTDFLGHPASTFVGTAKIAIKQKCPIIPAVAYRDKDGKNHFVVEEPILTSDITNTPENVKALTEQVSKRLENYIIKYPSQWFWVHKRWKGAKKAKISN